VTLTTTGLRGVRSWVLRSGSGLAECGLAECQALEERVREKLAVIDPRVVAEIAKER
jgi:hypothetical protein